MSDKTKDRLIVYTAFVIVVVAALASGVYLVCTDHGGWAWIPFLMAAFTSVKTSNDKSDVE